MAHIVSGIWSSVERSLFPALEEALGTELTEGLRRLVHTLEIVRLEEFVFPSSWQVRGRPRISRASIGRAFIAKAVLDIPETKVLRERLLNEAALRRICGFGIRSQVPSEATLSRTFAEFAASDLGRRVHEALVDKHVGELVVMHLCRDSTPVPARERPAHKPPKEKQPPKKRGRKGKNEAPPEPREPRRLEKQRDQTSAEAFSELPIACDKGCKADSHGSLHYWTGYKEHIDWTENSFPLTVRITSASVHDSQAAIPMARSTAARCTVLYELMDAGYDAEHVAAAIRELGHVPIIAISRRRKNAVPLDPATRRRLHVRTAAERGNSRLKDDFGIRHVRVRGAEKVHMHVMFGILALCADVLMRTFAGNT